MRTRGSRWSTRWPATAWRCWRVLDGRELSEAAAQAAALLATVLGQDLGLDEAGVFRIARRVAKDRVISTVDPETRHGHKTAARGFDGYKGHVGIDPDTEIITATTVSAGNVGDASAAEELISDLLDTDAEHPDAEHPDADDSGSGADGEPAASVYGDNAYGTGQFHDRLDHAGIESKCKTQQPTTTGGLFTKDRFDIDLEQDTVTCPAGNTAPIRRAGDGAGTASFGQACTALPATRAVHQGRRRTQHQHRSAREAARRSPVPAARPGLDRGLPRHPTQSGTQDRTPDAPPPRRAPRPGPRTDQGRRRLRPARRRRQPRTPRRARRGQHARPRMGHSGRVDQRSAGNPYPAAETLTTTPLSPAEHAEIDHRQARPPSAPPSAHRRSGTSGCPPTAVRHQPPRFDQNEIEQSKLRRDKRTPG